MRPAGPASELASRARLVILTGLSGSGKGTVLRALEDAGYYTVDNLPVDLMQSFAELCRGSADIDRAALVVDIREGEALGRFPGIYGEIKKATTTVLVYLEASDEAIQRRFSETRRPHPIQANTVLEGMTTERARMKPIHELADIVLDTSRFNVHDLRRKVQGIFSGRGQDPVLRVTLGSFGFKYGTPADGDLILDVRFLPNPNYEPECRNLTGKDAKVASFLEAYPQTHEFLRRTMGLLEFVVPHYAEEGKSYLAIYFGCTGGRHRSVYIADCIARRLAAEGQAVRIQHRDIDKEH